jgi:hypothetical protein
MDTCSFSAVTWGVWNKHPTGAKREVFPVTLSSAQVPTGQRVQKQSLSLASFLLLHLLPLKGAGLPFPPLEGTMLKARLHLHLPPMLGSLLLLWAFPSPQGYLLNLPATHRALGCVPEDSLGTGAAEVWVATGDKTSVGSMVEADDTLLSWCAWEKRQHKLEACRARGGFSTHDLTRTVPHEKMLTM